MNIGILTHYNVINLGAQLQMLAMKQWLEERNHKVYIMTYKKDYSFLPEEKKRNSASFKHLFYYFKNYFLVNAKQAVFYYKKTRKIKKIWKSLTFVSFDSKQIDCIIIGSDEVYSLDVGYNSIMFGAQISAKKIISYAPSFGRTTIDDLVNKCLLSDIEYNLKQCSFLSARDLHTQKMLVRLTNNRNIPIVCDPVFLSRNFSGKKNNKINKPYFLIYSYDRNLTDEKDINQIKKFAVSHGLITVSLGTYHKWCDKSIVCDPIEWISYFADASFVLTDTFHGSVVSIKNHCNVAIYIQQNINFNKLSFLLEQTKTKGRLINSISVKELERVYSLKLDYSATDAAIDVLIKKSEEYLEKSLGCVN